MGGRGSNSMDRLKRGGQAKPRQMSNDEKYKQLRTLTKAESAAKAAVTRAEKKLTLANASIHTYDGNRASRTYAGYLQDREKAEASLKKAKEKLNKIKKEIDNLL